MKKAPPIGSDMAERTGRWSLTVSEAFKRPAALFNQPGIGHQAAAKVMYFLLSAK